MKPILQMQSIHLVIALFLATTFLDTILNVHSIMLQMGRGSVIQFVTTLRINIKTYVIWKHILSRTENKLCLFLLLKFESELITFQICNLLLHPYGDTFT